MPTTSETVAEIRAAHRQRRFAMKIQQKLDRALESFVRRNATDWHPDLPEAERTKINNKVKEMIKATRAGKSDLMAEVIATSDRARAPADELRTTNEKRMEKLAETLPVYAWTKDIRGIGALGLATIVAECGDLSNYPNVAKVWKRLGYAPYDGLAGSTWKRQTWRPRALTAEEWIENPFSGERYALTAQIALWLRNAQWVGKAKTEDGIGRPSGSYGEAYAARRARTAVTHPDWSDGHADTDALRVMFKEFLKDLWVAWRECAAQPERPANFTLKSSRLVPDAPITAANTVVNSKTQLRRKRSAIEGMKPTWNLPSVPIQKSSVVNGRLKPKLGMRPKRQASDQMKPNQPLPDATSPR